MTPRRLTLGVYGPKAPEKSGVAEYIEESLSALGAHFACSHVSNAEYITPYSFDTVLYHLGNNGFHRCAFEALRARPGCVLLHEYNNLDYYYSCWEQLPGEEQQALLVMLGKALKASFASRRDVDAFFSAHTEIDRYAVEAGCESIAVRQATQVLTHSATVAGRLEARHFETAIQAIPFPVSPRPAADCGSARARYGIGADEFVFGSFGFIGEYKRIEQVFAAWQEWAERPADARLLIVGESQYPAAIPADSTVMATGYVSQADFDALLTGVDCGIQLRYPSLGETSGSISKLLAHARPVILSGIPEMGDYREYPRVEFVPVGLGEVEVLRHAMARQYDLGRCPRSFRQEFAWGRWLREVTKWLVPPAGGAHAAATL